MVTVNVIENKCIVTDELYQWDTNQHLNISGVSNVPITEIHFAHLGKKEALVVNVSADESGVISALIPNVLLQEAATINVYLCGEDGESFETYYAFSIKPKARPKPSDYVYEDSSVGNSNNSGAVQSVNGKTGIVNLTAEDVGALPMGSKVENPEDLNLTLINHELTPGNGKQPYSYDGKDEVNITLPSLPYVDESTKWENIKGRPFGSFGRDRYIDERVSFVMQPVGESESIGRWNDILVIRDGYEYTVTVDDTDYKCIGAAAQVELEETTVGVTYVGNPAYVGAGDDNGMPWVLIDSRNAIGLHNQIFGDADAVLIVGYSTTDDVILSIYEHAHFVKIPAEYLPDTAYELIETIRAEDAASRFTRTYTNTFDGIQLTIAVPEASGAYGAAVEFYTSDGLASYMWLPSMIDTSAKYSKISVKKEHGEWVFEALNPVATVTQTSVVQKNANYVSAEKPITKVVVYAASDGVFPVGTTIDIRAYNS